MVEAGIRGRSAFRSKMLCPSRKEITDTPIDGVRMRPSRERRESPSGLAPAIAGPGRATAGMAAGDAVERAHAGAAMARRRNEGTMTRADPRTGNPIDR